MSTAQVVAALVRAGKSIWVPYGDNRRYDLVIDEGGAFLRVQVKTGQFRHGAVFFPVCSTDWYRRTRRTYHGEIELFAVYCEETRKVYLVPIGEVDHAKRQVSLRVDPPKNGQLAKVRWAKDFEV